MNRLWLLRFGVVLSVIMMMSNTALSYTGNVWIRNSLPNQKDLIVHCKSAKEDIGYPGPTLRFWGMETGASQRILQFAHYEENMFSLYEINDNWCHLWQGHDFKHHQMFDVRSGEQWEAREDEIYRWSALVYAWDATRSKASSLGSSCISLDFLLVSLFFFYFI
ncbi:hypothetical protein Bca4012_055605 [Brassica carinata]|uniref:S-protein homolog n=1 Tax=Brassica carinata TaxID=52824 RepID=A0A8X7W366_BRACI|nr:hypothetical protein Bca52824_014573 [Brassica carinata]